MKKIDTVRALRDAEYRNSLTAEELAQLPAHPAGLSSVDDDALKSVTGGCAPTGCNNCGGGGPRPGSTFLFSCVQPPFACP
ncbi:MAG: mersacidin/lichenicidin family type 2 lantibiotic [Acidobacteriota bacterium]